MTVIYQIISMAFCALMLVLSWRKKNVFSKVITSVMVLALLTPVLNVSDLEFVALLVFMATLLASLIYGIKKSNLNWLTRAVVIMSSGIAFLGIAFRVLHLKGADYFVLLGCIPIILYIVSHKSKFWKEVEYPFTSIIVLFLSIQLLMLFQLVQMYNELYNSSPMPEP